MVLVADTYNHKIKVIDPFRNEVFSWLGSGKGDLKDDNTFNACLNEPSGIGSIFNEKQNDVCVYICDTNNHCVRRLYYDEGSLHTVQLKGVPATAHSETKPL